MIVAAKSTMSSQPDSFGCGTKSAATLVLLWVPVRPEDDSQRRRSSCPPSDIHFPSLPSLDLVILFAYHLHELGLYLASEDMRDHSTVHPQMHLIGEYHIRHPTRE